MSLRVQRIAKAKAPLTRSVALAIVERRNRPDSAITSLRYRYVRNDKRLVGHDMNRIECYSAFKNSKYPLLSSFTAKS